MGRTNKGRRLADPVFNMADELMADFSGNADSENRPFHAVYLWHKLPCPHISSRSEAGKVWGFFAENGLTQHFRAKHAGVVFDEIPLRSVAIVYWYLHGEETERSLERLSAERQLQVCVYSTSIVFLILRSTSQ